MLIPKFSSCIPSYKDFHKLYLPQQEDRRSNKRRRDTGVPTMLFIPDNRNEQQMLHERPKDELCQYMETKLAAQQDSLQSLVGLFKELKATNSEESTSEMDSSIRSSQLEEIKPLVEGIVEMQQRNVSDLSEALEKSRQLSFSKDAYCYQLEQMIAQKASEYAALEQRLQSRDTDLHVLEEKVKDIVRRSVMGEKHVSESTARTSPMTVGSESQDVPRVIETDEEVERPDSITAVQKEEASAKETASERTASTSDEPFVPVEALTIPSIGSDEVSEVSERSGIWHPGDEESAHSFDCVRIHI